MLEKNPYLRAHGSRHSPQMGSYFEAATEVAVPYPDPAEVVTYPRGRFMHRQNRTLMSSSPHRSLGRPVLTASGTLSHWSGSSTSNHSGKISRSSGSTAPGKYRFHQGLRGFQNHSQVCVGLNMYCCLISIAAASEQEREERSVEVLKVEVKGFRSWVNYIRQNRVKGQWEVIG